MSSAVAHRKYARMVKRVTSTNSLTAAASVSPTNEGPRGRQRSAKKGHRTKRSPPTSPGVRRRPPQQSSLSTAGRGMTSELQRSASNMPDSNLQYQRTLLHQRSASMNAMVDHNSDQTRSSNSDTQSDAVSTSEEYSSAKSESLPPMLAKYSSSEALSVLAKYSRHQGNENGDSSYTMRTEHHDSLAQATRTALRADSGQNQLKAPGSALQDTQHSRKGRKLNPESVREYGSNKFSSKDLDPSMVKGLSSNPRSLKTQQPAQETRFGTRLPKLSSAPSVLQVEAEKNLRTMENYSGLNAPHSTIADSEQPSEPEQGHRKSMFRMKNVLRFAHKLMLTKNPRRAAVWKEKASYVGRDAVHAFYDMYRSGQSTGYGVVQEAKNPIVHAPRGLERQKSIAAGMDLMIAAALTKQAEAAQEREAYNAALSPHSPKSPNSSNRWRPSNGAGASGDDQGHNSDPESGGATPRVKFSPPRSPIGSESPSHGHRTGSPRHAPQPGVFAVGAASNRPSTPRRAYVKKIDELHLVPELFGVVHDTGKNANVVSLRGYGVGDRKAEAIGAAIALKNFQKLDISSNRLSHIGARHLLTHLSPQCLELDAHANRIGVYGCLTISNCILKSQLHELMALNLGMNGLHDEAFRDLSSGLGWSRKLRRLNLSSNHMTSGSAFQIATALHKSACIEELDVSWNQIGAAALVVLLKIKSLLHLNVAWNSLGSTAGHDTEAGMPHDNNDFVTIASELASTKTLLHLDLSGNSFSAKSLAIIANGLASNHTLLGLHLDNQNHCAVDALAFIHVFGLGGSTPSEEGVDAGIANGNSGITGYSASQGDSGHFALDEATNHVGQPSSGGDMELAVKQWMELPYTLRRVGPCKHCWICNQAVETSFEISFELAERPKGTQTRSAAGPRAKSSNSAAHRNPELIGPALWKRLQDHGVDVHISIDGFVPHAATRVIQRASPRKGDAGPERMVFRAMRCMPPGNHFFYFAVPDAAARAAQAAALQAQEQIDMAAAAAAEAAASAAAAANSQDEEKAADTARRSAAGAFAGRVASMRPERILSHSYRMAQWHERNINDDILWKLRLLPEARTHLAQVEPHCKLNMVRVRPRNRTTALECQVAAPRRHLSNDVAAVASVAKQRRWTLRSSIFAPRAETADSRDFFDTESLHKKIAGFDWQYNKCKSFAKYEYSKSSASTADIDMALFAAAESRIVQLLDIFRTGCVCFADPTGPPTSMKINAFTALCKNGGLMTEWTFEPKPAPSGAVPLPTALTARALSIKEIDLIFIKTNIEVRAMKGTLLDKVNHDNPSNAINRFELTEAFVRIAALVFDTVGCKDDLTNATNISQSKVPIDVALTAVIDRCWAALASGKRVGPDGIITKAEFRADVLYTADMDSVLKAVEPHLQRIFHNLSESRRSDKFDTSGTVPFRVWIDFIQSTAKGLVPEKVKLDRVRMAFLTSKMAAVQCIEDPEITDLHFVDFVEALVRLAVLTYKPPKEKWPAFMSVCALFVYHFPHFRVDKKDVDPIAAVLRRYADASDYDLPVIETTSSVEDGPFLSEAALAAKVQEESEASFVWDKKAKSLHDRAKALDLVHDHREDDDD